MRTKMDKRPTQLLEVRPEPFCFVINLNLLALQLYTWNVTVSVVVEFSLLVYFDKSHNHIAHSPYFRCQRVSQFKSVRKNVRANLVARKVGIIEISQYNQIWKGRLTLCKKSKPLEVLGTILKNLNKTDFLNSRLVSRSWNTEALTQLKKSKFRQELNEKNIEDFIQFATQSSAQRLPLPLRIINNFTECEDEETETEALELELEMKQFLSAIESLQNLFGPECIRDLDLCVNAPMKTWSVLLEILTKLSPAVETLTLRSFKMRGEIDVDTLKISLRSMNFPNLRNLYLRGVKLMDPGSARQGREAQIVVCSRLIEAIPNFNLTALSLPGGMTSEELLHISPDRIKLVNSLVIEDENLIDLLSKNVNGLSLLRKLEISIYLGDNASSPPPKLLEALSSISTKLITLIVEFHLENPRRIISQFPTFPSLKEFKISSRVSSMPNFLNPEVFPAMTSIDIGVYLWHLLHYEFDSTNFPNQAMPTVQHLTLTLEGAFMFPPLVPRLKNPTFKQYLQLYHTLFPNLVKLTLVNIKTQETRVKLFLRDLLQSEIARNLNEIEMKNFDENYLGEILNQLTHPPRLVLENVSRSVLLERKLNEIFKDLAAIGLETSTTVDLKGTNGNSRTIIQGLSNQNAQNQLNITNVKKVTVELSQQGKENCTFVKLHYLTTNTRTTDEDEDDRRKLLDQTLVPLNLISLAQNLPNLEEIYISSRMFSPEMDKKIQIQEIQHVQTKFPNVKVVVI